MTGTSFRFMPSGSWAKAAAHSGAAKADFRYSGDSTMMVRSAAVVAFCISITKLLPGLKSQAWMVVVKPFSSSLKAIHSAQSLSTPV